MGLQIVDHQNDPNYSIMIGVSLPNQAPNFDFKNYCQGGPRSTKSPLNRKRFSSSEIRKKQLVKTSRVTWRFLVTKSHMLVRNKKMLLFVLWSIYVSDSMLWRLHPKSFSTSCPSKTKGALVGGLFHQLKRMASLCIIPNLLDEPAKSSLLMFFVYG